MAFTCDKLMKNTGEDALANLSIEKEGDSGPITGFVRIRSRSQGLALALGALKGIKAAAA
jgi:coatomer subunit beta